MRWTLVRLMVACCCITAVLDAGAAVTHGRKANEDRFVARYWSQIRPNLHFQYGCDTGWHSFNFRPDGYFVYDGKIAGHWWLDHLDNISLQTNGGERLELFYDGQSLLTQRAHSAEGPESAFGTEFRIYRECATDKVRLR